MRKVPSAPIELPSSCKEGCSDPRPRASTICPECGTSGLKVDLITVKALLKPSALRHLEGKDYHFCPSADCKIVYFDSSSDSRFRKADLLIRIGRKESEDPIPICYCFDFTLADVRSDLERRGESDIPETIAQEIGAGHCACEVKNPEGSCCLGNVREAMKRIKAGTARAALRGGASATPVASTTSTTT